MLSLSNVANVADVSGNNSAANVNLKPVTSTKQGNVGPKKSLNLADYKKKRGLI